MNIQTYRLLFLVLLTGSKLEAEPAAIPAPATTDPLTEVLPVLMSRYPDFQALHYKPGDRLEDLVARSNGELTLVAPDTLTPAPIITADLPDGVIYWRLASFQPKKDWAQLGTDLQNDCAHGTNTGAVLDLRSNESPLDMRGASQIASFFAPGDNTLKDYNIRQVDANLPSPNLALGSTFSEPLVVLTDGHTSGAAEVLAACLKADGALVVGTQTAGKGAAFADLKLSSGDILRYVIGHVHLADGVDLWAHPVVPDLTPMDTDHNERASLTLIRNNQVLDVIQESSARHRLSEATLVQGQDPEYDDYLSTLERKPVLLTLPVIHDPVLVGALDSLKAIRLSQRTLPVPPATTVLLPASTSIQ